MADALSDLKKTAEDLTKTIAEMKSRGEDTRALEDALKRVQSSMAGIATSAADSAGKIRKSFQESGSVITDLAANLGSAFAKITGAILEAGKGTLDYGEQFQRAFAGPDLLQKTIIGFDELTETTRNLRKSAMDVGDVFGLSFEQIRGSYQSYISSVLIAQESTYASRAEIQEQTKALAILGVGLDEIGKTFQVAGTQQNLLSEGFMLASDTGLRSTEVFDMMASAVRKMGISAEDAGKPLVSLENIARTTGLPIQELSARIFKTAEDGARLGLTVDSMTPIVRRFVDVLGPGFKGLAIDETTKIIRGLESQINSTQAAFIAMQGGLARPGAGVAEAQLAFEDAFKNPVEIIKSLQTTLAGVTGGKIIRFEEARANPELANQFKIQRDLLQQLTGNTDPQSQRTLMSILSDLQSGRQLTATQNRTLEESLKSGTQKQEERASLADRVGKAQVGLLTQIALNTSAFFERLLPPQAQAAMLNEGRNFAQEKGAELFNKALEMGAKLLDNNLPESIKKTARGAENAYDGFMKAKEKESGIRSTPTYSVPALPGTGPTYEVPKVTSPVPFGTPAFPSVSRTPVPPPVAPTPFASTIPPPAPIAAALPAASIRDVRAAAEKEVTNVVVTFRGTDDLTKALADAASVTVNKTLHGNG